MNEFNFRAYDTKGISRETARKWIKGLGLPRAEAMQILVDWLGINPLDLFSMNPTLEVTSLDNFNSVKAWHERHNVERLAKEAIHSVSPRIAILNLQGEIVLVNHAWRDHAFSYSHDAGKQLCEGVNYLDMCDKIRGYEKNFSHDIAAKIRSVILDEKANYSINYPCHIEQQKLWFNARITSFSKSNQRFVIVYHESLNEMEA
jgi:hypothetical protein